MVMCSANVNIQTYDIHMIIEIQSGFNWQRHNMFKLTISFQSTGDINSLSFNIFGLFQKHF